MPRWTQAMSMSFGTVMTVFSAAACSETATAPERIPTYHEDVAPILAANCVTCHQQGAIGPFALVNYQDALTYADAIRTTTASRSMPPFVLDNSGSCNTYVEGRWLTDAQIDTLGKWVKAGSPEGDPAKAIVMTAPERHQIERVDKTIGMDTSYTPDASTFDNYRCFVVDPQIVEDTFITAFDVRPGVAKMLHHLTLFAIDSESAEQAAEALDIAEAGPGYDCIDALHIEDTRWLVGWGPGEGAITLPKGTGLRMRAGRKALLQIHYNQENGIEPDRTQIDMMLAKSVEREARVQRVADTMLNLPPKQNRVEETASFPMPRAVTLWGLWPHMHELGVSLRVTATHDEKESCIANADRYNFHWQGFAHYTTPIEIDRGDKLRITCTYNTLERDSVTTWGQGTNDEMCIAFFYMTEN